MLRDAFGRNKAVVLTLNPCTVNFDVIRVWGKKFPNKFSFYLYGKIINQIRIISVKTQYIVENLINYTCYVCISCKLSFVLKL